MNPRSARKILAATAVLVLLAASACTAPTRTRWARVFFDGVPDGTQASGKLIARTPSDAAPAAPRPATPGEARSDRENLGMVVHRPYEERRCNACHESSYSQRLLGEPGDLCVLCHKELFAQATFRHAPAEAGNCLGCHNPHQSSEARLLVAPMPKLCHDCHEPADLARTPDHANVSLDACQRCHNPHGGGDRFFLRPKWKEAAPAIPTAATL